MDNWLTVGHAIHGLFAVALVSAILRKAWHLHIRAPIDLERLQRASRRGRVSADMALETLWNVKLSDGLRVAIEDARQADATGVAAIWGLTKLLVTVALVLGSYELIWLATGDHGLLALRAGYVQMLVVGRVSIHIAIGLGGFVVGRWAHHKLKLLVTSRSQILRSWLPQERSSRRNRR